MPKPRVFLTAALALALLGGLVIAARKPPSQAAFVSCRVDLRRSHLRLYWKDEHNQRFKSLGRLKDWLADKNQTLLFATNAGMFNPGYAPQGLFIEAGKVVTPLDTTTGAGNFYLKPNGVFYLTTANTGHICQTADFKNSGRITYATQSGPMLVIDGRIHPAFQPGSANLQIRNGVGILPDGRVLLAMSSTKINFYDFANYFKKAGCRQALYLDGFVSRAYARAEDRPQTNGDFGVIIGISEPRR